VDQITSQVDRLEELTDEQVVELQSSIISEFESLENEDISSETVDAMTSLADMLDTVRTELGRREAAAEELTNRASEAAMRVKGEVMEDDMGGEEAPEDEVVPTESPEDTDMPEESTDPSKEEEEEEKPMEMASDNEGQKMEEESLSTETETVVASSEASEEESTDSPEVTELSSETPDSAAVTETAEETEASTSEVEPSVAPETELSESEPEVEVEEAEVSVESTEAELASEEEETASVEEVEASEASEATEPEAELSTSEETPEVIEESELAATEETQSETIAQNEQEEQAIVTASAEESFQAPADRQPVLQVSEPAKVAITAGADIPGYTAGSPIEDMHEVAVAMEKRLHSLRRVNGGDGEQHIVASFSTQYPEERVLTSDPEINRERIDSVVGQEALVASGGHAAPFEVKYDIYGIGSTTERPIRDSLPAFQADRGGVRFVTPPSFAGDSYANAVGVWTAANDSAETPSPSSKLSLTVSAAAENTVATDAVTLQLQFGNLMTRAYPELISRHNELALVQHAREAEQYLVGKIDAASTATVTSSLLGFGRDFLVQLRRAATAYRSRHRISPESRLKALIPSWVYDAMAADLTMSMPGDGTISVSRAEIDGYLATINVDLVASPDMTVYSAQSGSGAALSEFPDSFAWYLFAEGTFLFLDGGTLDLGIIRDSTLVGTNDYKMFIETFEGVAKVGIESIKITSTIAVNGVAAALRDTTGGATAAAIEN